MTQLSFIPLGNTIITIYNKYQHKNVSGKLMTSWKRTVIPNCSTLDKTVAVTVDNISTTTSKQAVKIPLFDNYVIEYEWDNLLNEEMTNKFTVQVGDLIILKEVFDEVDEFSVIEDIENKYKQISFKISNVSNNYGKGYPLQHIEAVE